MASMNERRKAQRKTTNELFGIYNMETGKFIGKLIDLSIMGIKIQAAQNMDVGSIYKFKIDLPKPIAEKHYLAFEAKCVWCREDSSSNGHFDIGFQISEMIFDKIEIIQSLLDDALFYDSKEQLRIALAEKST